MLTGRALNRATLARQHLLARTPGDGVDLVSELVGLQAQNPLDPYVALWSRVEGFDPSTVAAAVEGRALVRMVVMRGTIHLVTAEDALVMRPLTQPVLDAELRRHRDHAPHLDGVDLAPALGFAASVLERSPLTTVALRAALHDAFPSADAAALAYACRCLLPLVQVPPRGVWGKTSAVTLTTLASWVGRPVTRDPSIDDLVVRYLRAYGPSTVGDVTAWSGLPGMREVVERLRPSLLSLRDDRGRELFDVEDAPRPDPDVPAPVRFLPEYDNVLLAHQDRSRFGPASRGFHVHRGSILVDGAVRGFWRRDGRALVVDAPSIDPSEEDDVGTEATSLAALLSLDGVRFERG